VAASLKRDPRFEVEVMDGRYGEFTVLLDGEEVISSGPLGFVGVLPSIGAVKDALEQRLRQRG
jgi:hypothetical protein